MMRLNLYAYSILIVFMALAAAQGTARADMYIDATGDLHDGSGGGTDFSGFTHLDISSVEITNSAADITFAITLVGDIVSTDWGKYMVILNTGAGGDTAGNGWNPRPISMPSGADYWLGSFVDLGSFQQWSWAGGWIEDFETSVDGITTHTVSFTTSLASIGVSPGDKIEFDVFSSGGGGSDGAVDALSISSPSIMDWGNPFSSDQPLSYTVVPAPGSALLAIIAVGAFGAARPRRDGSHR